MPDKKFKLSKKQGIYAAAGAVLAGTLTAAAITAPGLLKSAFSPDKYSFDDTRSNGDIAYNTSLSAQGASSEESNDDTSAASKPNDSKNDNEDISDTDSSEQEEEQKPEEEQNKEPEEAERDQDHNNNGSSEDVSEKAGTDEGGYALVNTGNTTNVASSSDSLAEYNGDASDNLVDMTDEEGVIVSSPEFVKPTNTPKKPEADTQAPVTSRPSATSRPHQTAVPSPTRIPASGGGSGTKTENPSESSQPQTSDVPSQTGIPSETEAPSPTERPEPTAEVTAPPSKEPMPTAEPDRKPQDAVKDNENNGNEVEVSKGGIGITDHHGGGGSISSSGATKIDFTKFTGDQSSVEYIQISSTITSINFETNKILFPNLKGYIVSENNKKYMSIDGVIYSKDGKILYACPAKLDAITEYPETLETIYDGAFIGSQMENIELPETVTTVSKKAFAEAEVGSLTLNSANVTLGSEVFYNSNADGLSVKKIVFKSLTPPEVENNDALKFKDPNTGLDTSGMIIEVPDSEDDKVYQAYVKAWGETIDGIYGSGMTSYLINTGTNAGRNYSFENNALYKRVNPIKPEETDNPEAPEETAAPDKKENENGLILLYVAPSTEGEFTPQFNTTVIGENAFDGCSEITSINLPATIDELQDGCFKGLDKLTSIIVAGTVPAKVGENVWKDINPDEVSIYVYPDSVQDYLDEWGELINKALGEGVAERIIKGASENYEYIDGALYAVNGDEKILVDAPHTNLDNFKIDDGTVEIAAGAFGSKYTYNYVVIPDSVKTIDKNAFSNTKIKILVMTSEEPPELPEGLNTSEISELYVPSGSFNKYKEAWGERFLSIEAPAVNYASEGHAVYGINEDGTYILFNLPVVASGSFTMLDTVKEIRERAMAECANVEGINFSVMIEKIGREAFINNTSLKSVDISRLTELKELPERAFYGNTAMTQMNLPILAEVIGNEFAAENTSLKTVNFDKLTNLTSIGEKAFYNNKSLEEVSLSSSRSLREIGESAFENCESVTVARMPLNLEVMCNKLFKNASSLERISFSSNLKEIGDETFYGTSLKSLNFTYNEKLARIGEGAFANNLAMTSLQLPKNVTSVSSRLVENNTALKEVVLSDKTEEIGDRAFAGCKELFEIEIPKTIKKIGEKVFDGCDKLVKVIVRAFEPAELGDEAFGSERNDLSIYVPDLAYDEYISAWDKTLFNKADQIIKKLSLIEDVDPNETPEPTDAPVTTPEPPSPPTMPPIDPPVGPTVPPEGTDTPEETANPEETEAPEETAAPEATSNPENTEEADTPSDNTSKESEDESSESEESKNQEASLNAGSATANISPEKSTEQRTKSEAAGEPPEPKTSASSEEKTASNDEPVRKETVSEEPKSAPPSKEDSGSSADSDI